VPIDVASYRRWERRARPTPLAALAIAGTMVRRRLRIRLVRRIIAAVVLGTVLLAAGTFLLTLKGEGDPMLRRQIGALGIANINLLAYLNHRFDAWIGYFAMLLGALVAAPLIAEDRRAHALPLYFSRPIGHVEYVAGKAAAAVFFLVLLLVLPRVAMYVVEVAFSSAGGVAWRQLPTLLKTCAVGGLGAVVVTAIALGISSLTERPTYAALFFLGIVMLALFVSMHLAMPLDDPNLLAIYPYSCVRRIALDLLPTPAYQPEIPMLARMDVARAWTSLGIWTAAGAGILVLRVRRVEVVT
jgi:ABC-type transport system involved in multi-copper enzyme maturation permease subunit